MADLFVLISAGLPYESLVRKIGGVPPPRRGSVVKLLGDSSLVPNNVNLTIIGAGGPSSTSLNNFVPKHSEGFTANA
jgi:hypothetical protein